MDKSRCSTTSEQDIQPSVARLPEPTYDEIISAVRSAEALAEHHVRYWGEYPKSSAYLGAARQLAGIRAALIHLEARRPGKQWRHKKRNSTYRVSEPVTIQCETPIQDGEQLLAYRADIDGTLWARRPDEFHDGRFERTTVPQTVVGMLGTTQNTESSPKTTIPPTDKSNAPG